MASYHGKNGLIYISGVEFAGANTWSLNISTESAEVPRLGQTFKERVAGQNDCSGNVTGWDQGTADPVADAALARLPVALLLYPDRATLTRYFSGNVIFGMSSGGGTGAAVSEDGDFAGAGTLSKTGWS